MKKKSVSDIAKAGDTVERLNEYLNQCTQRVAYVFIDLCGSTQLKERMPQHEWLPIVCKFLLLVSDCVQRSGGRVVKYIGDEVFAVFDDDGTDLSPARVEHFIFECNAALGRHGENFVAKYACDYGPSAVIDTRGDVLGTPIDRCARVAKLTKPGIALASGEFVNASKRPTSWRSVGVFKLRGLKSAVEVFQMRELGPELTVTAPEFISASADDLVGRIKVLEGQLESVRNELRTLRSRAH